MYDRSLQYFTQFKININFLTDEMYVYMLSMDIGYILGGLRHLLTLYMMAISFYCYCRYIVRLKRHLRHDKKNGFIYNNCIIYGLLLINLFLLVSLTYHTLIYVMRFNKKRIIHSVQKFYSVGKSFPLTS